MNKEQFKNIVVSKKEDEIFINFEDVDIPKFTDVEVPDGEYAVQITDKQSEIVEWCKEIPGCNWSVGFVNTEETSAFVVKWWFKDQDYPVGVSEE